MPKPHRAHVVAPVLACLAWAVSPAHAGTVWDEAVSGDLSGVGTAPTFIAVAGGTNDIFGSTGAGTAGTDLDYFTVTVPTGMRLTSLVLLPGTAPESLAFIGIQAGTQVTGFGASTLLGWTHYGAFDVGTDVLPRMGTGAGAIGFSGALGAGSYAFWVQDFDPGASPYGFRLTLAPVPEPAPALLWLGGLALLAARRLKR